MLRKGKMSISSNPTFRNSYDTIKKDFSPLIFIALFVVIGKLVINFILSKREIYKIYGAMRQWSVLYILRLRF